MFQCSGLSVIIGCRYPVLTNKSSNHQTRRTNHWRCHVERLAKVGNRNIEQKTLLPLAINKCNDWNEDVIVNVKAKTQRTDNMTNLKPIETSDGRSVQNLLTQLLLFYGILQEQRLYKQLNHNLQFVNKSH